MNSNTGCLFCRIGIKGLLEELPSKSKNCQSVPCNRGIYEDAYCVATLAPEQYSQGHTLVILKNHRTDMVDSSISSEELVGFVNAIHKLTKHLKKNLRDSNDKAPERIYVCSLCDGVEHLHAHLIPRYPKTGKGFQYIGELEKNYKESEFWKKSDEERAHNLQELAERLRLQLL